MTSAHQETFDLLWSIAHHVRKMVHHRESHSLLGEQGPELFQDQDVALASRATVFTAAR